MGAELDKLFIFRDIDFITIARVTIAFILGGVVGFERERVQRPAGLRTHMLVAAGCCCFTVASIYGFDGLGTVRDPARLAATDGAARLRSLRAPGAISSRHSHRQIWSRRNDVDLLHLIAQCPRRHATG